MICPRCSQSITYKERNNNQCSKCYKEFAFEPKTHPLLLTDKYFLKTVEKLSDNGKYSYTPDQLQMALSRKKLKGKGAMVVIVILAIVTSIIAGVVFAPLLIFAIPFWIVVIVAQQFYFRKFVAPPQTFPEFDRSVIYRWKEVYGEFPKNMIVGNPSLKHQTRDPLRGILFCETRDTANCVVANQLNLKLGLAVFTDASSDPVQMRADLPVYVLHDAGGEGYEFLEKIRQHFGVGRQIIDLGLRPRSVMNSKLLRFRQQSYTRNDFSGLTPAEVKWLYQGYYTPLAVLRPAQLFHYLTKQIERRSKQAAVETPEKAAQAVGFMTWVGEK
jgi:hypothetical protein